MYLKKDRIVVTIKDLQFRSFQLAGNRFVLDPTAIIGWTDGTAARRDTTTRAVSHGDFYETATMSSRLISLSGTAVALNRQELQKMRDSFVGALSTGEYTEISIETTADTRYTTVGLEGIPSFVQLSDNVASWKIDLYAPDPFIYGLEKVSTTGANMSRGGLKFPLKYRLNYNILGANTAQTVTNQGNAQAFPKFRAVGDFYSGFSIEDNLGSVVTYAGMVTHAAPVIIDMAMGTAIQGGVDKTTLITRRDWFSIPAGGTIQPKFVPIQNGSGWCDIIYRDTWI